MGGFLIIFIFFEVQNLRREILHTEIVRVDYSSRIYQLHGIPAMKKLKKKKETNLVSSHSLKIQLFSVYYFQLSQRSASQLCFTAPTSYHPCNIARFSSEPRKAATPSGRTPHIHISAVVKSGVGPLRSFFKKIGANAYKLFERVQFSPTQRNGATVILFPP